MTLHEKICQLFFVAPEQFSKETRVYKADKTFLCAFSRFPVGGIILFSANIRKDEIASLNAGMQSAAAESNGIGLFIGVDEEGGSVSRVANRLKLKEKQPAPAKVETPEDTFTSGQIIGGYLAAYGFNLDFAPVADVRSGVPGAEITVRSYGSNPEHVSRMVSRFTEGLHKQKIISVLKHFPGHGAVSGNTHEGAGVSLRTLEELRKADFIPFAAGIAAGADMVMVSHQIAENLDPERPASLSPTVIGILREELGFDGVIITDALRMKAVSEEYGSGEACVLALEAGADMLLLPYNFTNAFDSVTKAVKDGRLTEERIDESLSRILSLKEKYGLLGR
jgi:beta-N-acetylhexosaminidase